MHQNKVIHVTAIIAHVHIMFNEMVKSIQINIGKHLAGQIANR